MGVRIRRLTVALGTSALVASAMAATAAPAAALPDCTIELGPGDDNYTETITSGMVVCGGDGNDTVDYMTGGVFIGGQGDDVVVEKDGGRFYGNNGADVVEEHNGGKFVGGYGRDEVIFMNGGTFEGGRGMDRVYDDLAEGAVFYGGPQADNAHDDVFGTFVGGAGADWIGGHPTLAPYVLVGEFNGGKGKDHASDIWWGGIFRGGPAPDTVEYIDEDSRVLGNKGNDVVEASNGFFNGGPGFDTGSDCGGSEFVSVESQPACVAATGSGGSTD